MTARRSSDLSAPAVSGSEPPDTGGTFATAQMLALGDVFSGSVTGGSDGTDMFRVTSTREGVLAMTLAGLTGAVRIDFYSAGGQFLGSASGGASGSLSLVRLVAPGTDYFVAIRAESAAVLPYQLVVGYSPLSGTADGDTLGGSTQGDMMAGAGGDDSLLGYQGDDTIYGGDGNDTLVGGTGNDTLVGGTGSDLLAGNAGNDVVYAGSDGATVQGGTGDDLIYGSLGDDLIQAGSGRDWITGAQGNDTVYGGGEEDTIYGTFGTDLIFGGGLADTLYGGADADTLRGDAGNDWIEGGSARDLLYGGLDDDTLIGGNGADTLYGGDGNDLLQSGGGSSADTSANTLFGGTGADTLSAGEGSDVLNLGPADGAADRVLIRSFADSGLGALSDRVIGFERGLDLVDVSLLDTDPVTAGRQALAWGDTTATAHGVWWQSAGPDVLLWIDSTGDAVADGMWRLSGVAALSQDDLLF